MTSVREFFGSHFPVFDAISPYFGTEAAEAALPSYINLYGAASVRLLSHCGVLILKPDYFASGHGSQIIPWLSGTGISVLAALPVPELFEGQLEDIYRYNLGFEAKASMLSKWWVYRRAYSLDDVNACVLVVTSQDSDSVYERLARLKGKSSPLLCVPGQLRRDFGARSRTLNLAHTCDDPLDAIRVLSLLAGDLTGAVVEEALQAISASHQRAPTRVGEILDGIAANSQGSLRGVNIATALYKASVSLRGGEWTGVLHDTEEIGARLRSYTNVADAVLGLRCVLNQTLVPQVWKALQYVEQRVGPLEYWEKAEKQLTEQGLSRTESYLLLSSAYFISDLIHFENSQ